jgi:hypothetical protein
MYYNQQPEMYPPGTGVGYPQQGALPVPGMWPQATPGMNNMMFPAGPQALPGVRQQVVDPQEVVQWGAPIKALDTTERQRVPSSFVDPSGWLYLPDPRTEQANNDLKAHAAAAAAATNFTKPHPASTDSGYK